MAGAANLTDKQRAALPASAFCGRGRSFPVIASSDIANAVSSMGRAADDAERAQIKACIMRKARANGWMASLPQEWRNEMMGNQGNAS